MKKEEILALLKREVTPALGCTEPGAVALAAAHAYQAIGGEVSAITVTVDGNVYKNGLAVYIGGTKEVGLALAAALGVICGEPERKLEVLHRVTAADVAAAKRLVAEGKVAVKLADRQGLYIEAAVKTQRGTARSIIQGKHTNLCFLEVNGVTLIDHRQAGETGLREEAAKLTVQEIVGFAETVPADNLAFLAEGVRLNEAAAEAGLKERLGMAVGAHLQDMIREGLLAGDVVNAAKVLTAAGADARMSGWPLPVMSSAGSGNHGLTAILPVVAVFRRFPLPEQRLVRALAVSHLTTVWIKAYTGGLSALCGCAVAAATGAGAATAWMLGGTVRQIDCVIKNMVGNLTGMICDGGKVGCALKLATAAGTAVEAALLALKNVEVPASNGIIMPSAEDTVRNLGKVSNPGMLATDRVILELMLAKAEVAGAGVAH